MCLWTSYYPRVWERPGTDAYDALKSEPVRAPPPIPYPTATTDPHHPCYPQSTDLLDEPGNLSTTLEYEDFQECLEPSSSIGVQTEEQSCASLGIQTKGNGAWVTKAAAAREEQMYQRTLKETCEEACEQVAKKYQAIYETLNETIAMATATIEEHKLAEATAAENIQQLETSLKRNAAKTARSTGVQTGHDEEAMQHLANSDGRLKQPPQNPHAGNQGKEAFLRQVAMMKSFVPREQASGSSNDVARSFKQQRASIDKRGRRDGYSHEPFVG